MHPYFLSCDWGTSSFRLRLIDAARGAVLAAVHGTDGIQSVHAGWIQSALPSHKRMVFYCGVIQQHIHEMRLSQPVEEGTPVLISGMASSNIGMMELPYAMLPVSTTGSGLGTHQIAASKEFPHPILLISGAATENDVVRGEETQLTGCVHHHWQGAQLFIFPGTHSKHIRTVDDRFVDISTYMTGEFFAWLSRGSVLAGSVQQDGGLDEDGILAAFAAGVQAGAENPLLHAVFSVRVRSLFNKATAASNYHYLSGILIGSELAALKNDPPASITLVGEENLLLLYQRGIHALGLSSQVHLVDASTATVQGQLCIYRMLYQS